jgi:hypothetical protein
MNVSNEIKALTEKLSHEWYFEKLSQFQDVKKGYNPNSKTRVTKIAEFDSKLDEKTGEIYSEISWEGIVEITFEEFCWLDEERLDEHFMYYPDEILTPVDAYTLIIEFSQEFEKFLPKGDVTASFNILNNLVIQLEESLKSQALNCEDEGYRQVCEYLSKKGTTKIKEVFENVVHQYIYGEKSPHKLQFELNKQQLAALIHLIDKAGMISKNEIGIIGKYKFFETFFYWTDQSNDQPQRLPFLVLLQHVVSLRLMQ